VIEEPFEKTVERMTGEKAALAKKQAALLEERYDLRAAPAAGVTMSRGSQCREAFESSCPPASRAGMRSRR
jgi:hypothetical protein